MEKQGEFLKMEGPLPLPDCDKIEQSQGAVEKLDFFGSTGNQGDSGGGVQPEKWTGVRGSRIRVRDVTGEGRRFYFCAPQGKAHPDGNQQRLSDIPSLAMRRAIELDRECVPIHALKHGKDRIRALRRIVRDAFNAARSRSLRADRPFKVTEEYVEKLLWKQGCKCAVSGLPFRYETALNGKSWRGAYRPSLDRILPSKGYVPGNVRLVLTIVNIALSDWGDDTLIEVAKAIAVKNT